MKFNQLNLNEKSLQTLAQLGFEEPTPIQEVAIPYAIQGKDLVGQAQTGTGKTAAFTLPMLEHLEGSQQGIQALVITPTRELAIQVQDEIFKLSKGQQVRSFVVYGGSAINKQIQRFKRVQPQVIVGTPGRILDLLKRKIFNLNHLRVLVLDEADEMLNMGFIEDITAIIELTPPNRQTMMFSATMPQEVQALSQRFLTDPVSVRIEAETITADLIDQYFVKCQDVEKFDILTRFLDVHQPKQTIIFCRTKKRVDEVGRGLVLRGFNAELIHGDITQQKRNAVMKEFKSGQLEVLVATDVAARGIDISDVTHVYNYDIPQDPESYVHRIGRTGRAGQNGMAITFVQRNEMAYLRTIEKLIQKQMIPMRPPTDSEARHGQVEGLIETINQSLDTHAVDRYRNIAKFLLQHYQTNDLVAALLKELVADSRNQEVVISPQKPLPRGNKPSSGQSNKPKKRYYRNQYRQGKRKQERHRNRSYVKNKSVDLHKGFTIRKTDQ